MCHPEITVLCSDVIFSFSMVQLGWVIIRRVLWCLIWWGPAVYYALIMVPPVGVGGSGTSTRHCNKFKPACSEHIYAWITWHDSARKMKRGSGGLAGGVLTSKRSSDFVRCHEGRWSDHLMDSTGRLARQIIVVRWIPNHDNSKFIYITRESDIDRFSFTSSFIKTLVNYVIRWINCSY